MTPWSWLTGRASVQYSQRRYNQWLGCTDNEDATCAMRAFFVQNHNQTKANAIFEVALTKDLTISPNGGLRWIEYPTDAVLNATPQVTNSLGTQYDRGETLVPISASALLLNCVRPSVTITKSTISICNRVAVGPHGTTAISGRAKSCRGIILLSLRRSGTQFRANSTFWRTMFSRWAARPKIKWLRLQPYSVHGQIQCDRSRRGMAN